MSLHFPNSVELARIRNLEQQIRSLEKRLEEKEETCFELSVTMASVQAEADYKVSQFQKQHQRGVAVTPRATPNGHREDASSGKVQRRVQTAESSIPPLGQHLLKISGLSLSLLPPNLLVLVGSPTTNPDGVTSQLLWKLVELCLADEKETLSWEWLDEVLVFSARARIELCSAMEVSDRDDTTHPIHSRTSQSTRSRISGGAFFSWNHVSLSVREPLGTTSSFDQSDDAHQATVGTSCRPYNRQLAGRLREVLLTLESDLYAHILSTLLSDLSNSDKMPWKQLLCGSTTAPLFKVLRPLLSSSDGTLRAHRSATFLTGATPPTNYTPPTYSYRAVLSLRLLRDCGGWPCVQAYDEASRDFLGLLLDLLEGKYIAGQSIARSPTDIMLIAAVLQVIQYTICHYPARGVRSLRTQVAVGGGGDFACSGVGVVVQVLYESTVLFWEPEIFSECVQIIHFVLKQIQQERQRAEESSTTAFVSFLSVVSEHEHLYLAACHELVRRGGVLSKLVQLQLEELAVDEEEEEELKMQRHEQAGS